MDGPRWNRPCYGSQQSVRGFPVTSSSASNWMEPAAAHAGEVRKLSTLLEASQALSSTLDLKEALQRVLEILGRHHGAIRSTVVLLNEETGEVELEASAGAVTRRQARALPGRRRHHRPGRADRQADRRAARQPRADVPESRRRSARAAGAGADLHLGARSRSTAGRSAPSASICTSRPIATTTAPPSSSASSAR